MDTVHLHPSYTAFYGPIKKPRSHIEPYLLQRDTATRLQQQQWWDIQTYVSRKEENERVMKWEYQVHLPLNLDLDLLRSREPQKPKKRAILLHPKPRILPPQLTGGILLKWEGFEVEECPVELEEEEEIQLRKQNAFERDMYNEPTEVGNSQVQYAQVEDTQVEDTVVDVEEEEAVTQPLLRQSYFTTELMNVSMSPEETMALYRDGQDVFDNFSDGSSVSDVSASGSEKLRMKIHDAAEKCLIMGQTLKKKLRGD